VGVPTYPLGFVMGGILLAGAAYWLAYARPRRLRGDGRGELAPAAAAVAEGAPDRATPERATPLDDVPVR
jgi:hypothetical protein